MREQELGDLMKGLGRPMPADKLQAMIAEVDTDGGGSIGFDEFLQLMEKEMKKHDPLDEARKAFKMFDTVRILPPTPFPSSPWSSHVARR